MRVRCTCDAVNVRIDVVFVDTVPVAYSNVKMHLVKNRMNSLVEVGQALNLFENLMRRRAWIELVPTLLSKA